MLSGVTAKVFSKGFFRKQRQITIIPNFPLLSATLTLLSSFQKEPLPSTVVNPAFVVTTIARSASCP
uniref:Uncharacterized protein n=1 Tax=Meloidogyne incognita TaxID=6306 RepID=A0A914M1W8_MELIC